MGTVAVPKASAKMTNIIIRVTIQESRISILNVDSSDKLKHVTGILELTII